MDDEDYRVENEHLREALVSARVIGAAIGIVMERTKRTYEQAFESLTRVSERQNTKLRKVADTVVFTGELPAAEAKQQHDRPAKPPRSTRGNEERDG